MKKSVIALWFTGLPASGKSTLANLLAQELEQRRQNVQVLESDHLREVLTPQPTYSPEERAWFYKSLAYIASLLVENDVSVLIAATAHRSIYRLQARQYLNDLIEVYVKCSLETCMARDRKGIYSKAKSQEAVHVPGVQELYEAPESPAVVVDTEHYSQKECVNKLLERLVEFGYIE